MKFLSDSTPWNGRARSKYNKEKQQNETNEMKSNQMQSEKHIHIYIRIMAIDYINSRHSVCTSLDLFIWFAIAFIALCRVHILSVCQIRSIFCSQTILFESKLNLQSANLVRDHAERAHNMCTHRSMYPFHVQCMCVNLCLCNSYCYKTTTAMSNSATLVEKRLTSSHYDTILPFFFPLLRCVQFLSFYARIVLLYPIGHIVNVNDFDNCAWWCLVPAPHSHSLFRCFAQKWMRLGAPMAGKMTSTIAASDYQIKKFDVLIIQWCALHTVVCVSPVSSDLQSILALPEHVLTGISKIIHCATLLYMTVACLCIYATDEHPHARTIFLVRFLTDYELFSCFRRFKLKSQWTNARTKCKNKLKRQNGNTTAKRRKYTTHCKQIGLPFWELSGASRFGYKWVERRSN